MKKPLILFFILLFITFGIAAILLFTSISIEVIGIFIAWLIGIIAILQTQIKEFFFPPILQVKVEEVLTNTMGGWNEKWFNLVIKNCGYEVAKNIMVKIKDGENKSWVNFKRPFFEQREDKIFIPTLAVGDNEAFNIGHADSRDNKFKLATNLMPNNQKMILNLGENNTYFVGVVADNIKPLFFMVNINNQGYLSISISNITIDN